MPPGSRVQVKAAGLGPAPAAEVGPVEGHPQTPSAIAAQLGQGEPLGAAGGRVAAAFGGGLPEVRVHTDDRAQGLARAMDARAFTVGPHVAFAAGEYAPGTPAGDLLLAHELAHVVQQQGAVGLPAAEALGARGHDPLEDEADSAAVDAVASLRGGPSGGHDGKATARPQLRSQVQLQRSPGSKYPVPDVSGLNPKGHLREAVLALSQSDELVDRNTARQVAEGNIQFYYFEELKQPPDMKAALGGLNPEQFIIYLHPRTGEKMLFQKPFVGSNHGHDIFARIDLSVAFLKGVIVHEISHALNAPGMAPIGRYESEFRAYWVAEFRKYPDLDDRARRIKEHILGNNLIVRQAYASDPAVKAAIDAYTRPTGDITNATGLAPQAPRGASGPISPPRPTTKYGPNGMPPPAGG